MNESSDDAGRDSKPQSQEVVEQLRTEKPQGPVGADEPNPNVVSDRTSEEMGEDEEILPGIGGYDDRDAKTDMPRVPTVAATQDDPESDDAAPSGGKERDAGE